MRQLASVELEAHTIAGRDDIYRLHRAWLVVPVPHDVDAVLLDVHPAVPHHLVGEIAVLRDTERIDHAAAAVVLYASEVGVGIGEDDLCAAGADAPAGAGPLAIIVIPAPDVLDHELVLIVVVRRRIALHAGVGSG